MMLFSFNILFSLEPLAVIIKSKGKVKYKLIGSEKVNPSKSGIISGSQIQTSKNSFLKIAFLDNGSTLSIYPDSEILISGEINGKKIDKQMDFKKGVVQLNIVNQDSAGFKLLSESSEVTCSNCNYWGIVEDGNDKYILNKGIAEVYNLSTNSRINMTLDSMIVSKDKEAFEVNKINLNKKNFLKSIMILANENNNDSYKKYLVQSDSSSSILVIKLKNETNIEREISITLKK